MVYAGGLNPPGRMDLTGSNPVAPIMEKDYTGCFYFGTKVGIGYVVRHTARNRYEFLVASEAPDATRFVEGYTWEGTVSDDFEDRIIEWVAIRVVCPECGEDFDLKDDYLCEECRSLRPVV